MTVCHIALGVWSLAGMENLLWSVRLTPYLICSVSFFSQCFVRFFFSQNSVHLGALVLVQVLTLHVDGNAGGEGTRNRRDLLPWFSLHYTRESRCFAVRTGLVLVFLG